MKSREREQARILRLKGWSVRAIAYRIHCSRSSVSGWVRDIALTPTQIERLKSNQDKGRAKAANHPNSPKFYWARRRQEIMDDAEKDIPRRLTIEKLKIIGSALYWAEGFKAGRNLFVFANSDPDMIRIMFQFLAEVCHVPKKKLRARVTIHPSHNIEIAER